VPSPLACALGTYLLQSALTYCSRSTRRLSLWSAVSSLCTALPPLLVLLCACALSALALSALLRSRRLLAVLACALGACLRSRRLLALSALAAVALLGA